VAKAFSFPVLVCLAVTLALAGPARALTVRDAAGRTVEIPARPERIVCLGSGCLRLLVYLGVADKVVGIEKFEKTMALGRPYRLAHPELLSLPVISPGGPQNINQFPDIEGVLSVAPQVVFVTFMEPGKADELQDRIKIPVVVLGYGKFASYDARVFDSLDIAGEIMDRTERAADLRHVTTQAEKDIRDRAARAGRSAPRVYVGGSAYKGLHGLTSTDNPYVPLEWLGVDNPAVKDAPQGHVFLDKEKLLAVNPGIVCIDAAGLSLVAEDFAASPQYYQALEAFRQGRVYVLYPFTTYVTNLETMIVDAYAAGKILYPEAFADVDMKAKTSEVFVFFDGKDVSDQMAADYGALGAQPEFLTTRRESP
jgi:iron complex transport system substrate-binding protein